MTTIQDRIIKKYNQIFRGTVMWQEHESFLIQSIKEVEEETRKETKQEIAELKIKVRDLTNHCKKL